MHRNLLLSFFVLIGITVLSQNDPPQPFSIVTSGFVNGQGPNMLSAGDTGIIQICPGSSVLLVAHPNFPNSFENTGTGYSQTAENVQYHWMIGTTVLPVNNDSIVLSPPASNGYFISLQITDGNNVEEEAHMIIQVAAMPVFYDVSQSEDSLCIGEEVVFSGGISESDTNNLYYPPVSYLIAGFFTNNQSIPLPDGFGVTYTSVLNFPESEDTILSIDMVPDILLSIEHSFCGDLEISLTCPSGAVFSVANLYSNSGGMLDNGCSAGATFLGNDTNVDGEAPSQPAWSYNISASSGTITFCDAISSETITNSYGFPTFDTAVVYLPDGNPDTLIGCPVQGDWTLSIRDNQGIDDGYVLGWSLFFEETEDGFTNFPVASSWTGDNIQDVFDTSIVVLGVSAGTAEYSFLLTDNFGCINDTTLNAIIIDCLPLELPELSLGGELYPNPVTAEINYSGSETIYEIKLIDLSGRTMETYASFPINISAFPSGMYQLLTSTPEGIFGNKIVKAGN